MAEPGSFDKANTFYSKGRYEEAAKEYEKILSEGKLSTDLYYNIGNVHYIFFI